jgi:NAD(P)-dependent dehydrogenase (short-subunit alcohol dehydrogenase family)
MMDDPFFHISKLNACYVLTALYTCVAHVWVAVVSRKAGEKNQISYSFPPSNEVTKKLAIVTGSNSGIGFETAKRLVREYGWDVILACRSKDKALIARNLINDNYKNDNWDSRSNGKAIVLEPVLDLSDFNSIRKYVDAIQNEYDNIDVLINNAGRNTGGRSPGDPKLDLMFQSNYLGHFLLTELLLKNELLLSSSSTTTNGSGKGSNKIINLSSAMHHFSKGDALEENGFESVASPDYWKRRAMYSEKDIPDNLYSATKLAAILHSVELNRRYGDKNLTSIACNPGAVNSDIWRGFPLWVRRHVFDKIYLTTEEGSEPIIAAAIRDDLTLDKENGMANNGRGAIIYLQPYANPFSIFGGRLFADSSSSRSATVTSSSRQGPMPPFAEMLGPYVGHLPTVPRLPKNTEAAAETLWNVSEQLTKL